MIEEQNKIQREKRGIVTRVEKQHEVKYKRQKERLRGSERARKGERESKGERGFVGLLYWARPVQPSWAQALDMGPDPFPGRGPMLLALR